MTPEKFKLSLSKVFKNRFWRILLKTLGITAAVLVVLLIGAYIALCTSTVQNKLMDYTTQMLSERLKTRVNVDSVSVALPSLDIKLYGMSVDDRSQRKMLEVGNLTANVDLWRLLKKDVRIGKISAKNVNALLIKQDSDSVANFQFLIDALKNDHVKTEEDKNKLKFNVNKIDVEKVKIKYNDAALSLGRLNCSLHKDKVHNLEGDDIAVAFNHTNHKGITAQFHIGVGKIKYSDKGNLTVDNFKVHSDNHRPRKNANNPNRGFFDDGHLDMAGSMKFTVNHITADTIVATLDHGVITDSVAGIDVRDLNCGILATRKGIRFSNVNLQQVNSKIHFDRGDLHFPSAEADTVITYATSKITGDIILKDISRPFAPPLRNFSIPLRLSTDMHGDYDRITFTNVVINTANNKLIIKAHGDVWGIKFHDSHAIKARFNVDNMTIAEKYASTLVTQFPIRRLMMTQLNALGAIRYQGVVDVAWRHPSFHGTLSSRVGSLSLSLNYDGGTKFMTGNIATNALNAGRLFSMPNIGEVAATANFRIDLSRTRKGKLPVGEASAHVTKASYKSVKTNNLIGEVKSDGVVANGTITAPAKFADLSCTFSFDNTDNLHKMEVKPALKFHKAKSK